MLGCPFDKNIVAQWIEAPMGAQRDNPFTMNTFAEEATLVGLREFNVDARYDASAPRPTFRSAVNVHLPLPTVLMLRDG